jgi:hypothetical protein
MYKDRLIYFTWQCLLVLFCGITGLIAVFIKTNLPWNVSILFTITFIMCIFTAVFFLIWIRQKIKQEEEDFLIDSIGETDEN